MSDLKLTQPQIHLLLNLLKDRKEEGSYYGRKDYYTKRLDQAIAKLEREIK